MELYTYTFVNNYAFVNNSASICFYKSQRKNAKVLKAYYTGHLRTKNEDRKIDNDRMKSQFIEWLEYVSYYSEPGNINMSVSCHEWKNPTLNGKKETQHRRWETGRLHFDNFTEAAQWLYFNLFCRIYPYCEIDFTEIETEPEFKYFLNKSNKL